MFYYDTSYKVLFVSSFYLCNIIRNVLWPPESRNNQGRLSKLKNTDVDSIWLDFERQYVVSPTAFLPFHK